MFSWFWYVLDNAEICGKPIVLLENWKNQEKIHGMECCAYDIDVDRLERERNKRDFVAVELIFFAVEE